MNQVMRSDLGSGGRAGPRYASIGLIPEGAESYQVYLEYFRVGNLVHLSQYEFSYYHCFCVDERCRVPKRDGIVKSIMRHFLLFSQATREKKRSKGWEGGGRDGGSFEEYPA